MTHTKIQVLEGGFSTTLQDLGRPSTRKYGVPPGGALDRFALKAANRLVQNSEQAAVLEITLQGPSLLFENAALIALTGAEFGAELSDGRKVPNWLSFFVRPGQRLNFNGRNPSLNWGRCVYLALHGGIAAPVVMASRSTYLRAALGGYRAEGRALTPGDVVEGDATTLRHLVEGAGQFLPSAQRPCYNEKVRLRLVPGPYLENFAPQALPTLLSNTYTLTSDADRVGFRLEGVPLAHARPELAGVESCGTVFGAIQIPPNGQPIVLMADHQVTGGYPIVATVVFDDLPLLAQLLPGGQVEFQLT